VELLAVSFMHRRTEEEEEEEEYIGSIDENVYCNSYFVFLPSLYPAIESEGSSLS